MMSLGEYMQMRERHATEVAVVTGMVIGLDAKDGKDTSMTVQHEVHPIAVDFIEALRNIWIRQYQELCKMEDEREKAMGAYKLEGGLEKALIKEVLLGKKKKLAVRAGGKR